MIFAGNKREPNNAEWEMWQDVPSFLSRHLAYTLAGVN